MYTKTDAFLLIQLNYERIKLLRLEVDAESIRYRFVFSKDYSKVYVSIIFSICTSKLKLKPNEVIVESDTIITVHPNSSKNSRRLNFALSELKEQIPNVVVKVIIFFC